MQRPDWEAVLQLAKTRALEFLRGLPERRVKAPSTARDVLRSIDRPFPTAPSDAHAVVDAIARAADPGLTAMPSGRFFGWVIGGGLASALATDWLAATWDQNAGSYEGTPSAAAFEQVALRWVVQALGLPSHSSGALVTGAQMANMVGLASARNALLHDVGWDVEARGLAGAPPIHAVVGEERHDTVPRALRFLGLGAEMAHVVASDANGRMVPDALAHTLASLDGPIVVCAQVGNVNTGGIDPVDEIANVIRRYRERRSSRVWLHVDGAFGLWARASRSLAPLVRGIERADSWATDAHKWPNIPYDCGIAIVAHPEAHRRAMSIHASYLPESADADLRNPFDWTPELSRRARGFALYAGLMDLGAEGLEALVDRSTSHARRFRDRLGVMERVVILNEVELNQVLVRFLPKGADSSASAVDEHTRAVVRSVQEDGTCYVSGTTWRGVAAMRISVSNWSTDDGDVERSIDAMARAHLG